MMPRASSIEVDKKVSTHVGKDSIEIRHLSSGGVKLSW